MEEIVMQSGMVELGIWEVFVQSRISISIIFLANAISILIAVIPLWFNTNTEKDC